MSLLGDDIARALPELRAQALSCMVDSGHVEAITGSSNDPSTHQRINAWTPSWTGPMQVRVTSIEQMVLAGGQEVAVVRAMVDIPDHVTVTTQHRIRVTSTRDPLLAGVPLYVRAVQPGTWLARRKLTVTSDQG